MTPRAEQWCRSFAETLALRQIRNGSFTIRPREDGLDGLKQDHIDCIKNELADLGLEFLAEIGADLWAVTAIGEKEAWEKKRDQQMAGDLSPAPQG